MVVFTCNHCGESLHKPSVEKHYAFVCRRVKSLTCVDCFRDFWEEEYVTHTKCITEEERYSAKGSMPNGVVKKGELKQESWIDMIKSILDKESNLKHSHRNLLETISNYSNVPRKKPKFLNFIRSSSGGRVNMKDVEEVWNIIEKYKITKASGSSKLENAKSEDKQNFKLDTSNCEDSGNNNVSPEEPKKKKRKKSNAENEEKSEISTEVISEETNGTEKFNFQEKIISVLESKGAISLKKLEKKVINAYLKHSGESEVSLKTVKKFNKKLKKIPNIEITDDSASLKQM